MISEKKLIANRRNLQIAVSKNKHKHFGKSNPNWNNGNRLKGNFPCPECGADRNCEKRNSNRICRVCFLQRGKKFNWKKWRDKIRLESKKFAFEYLGGKCAICGSNNLPLCCYHFHHKNPKEKSFELGAKFNQKISPTIKDELDKCVILCANCHAIVHHKKIDLNNYDSHDYS